MITLEDIAKKAGVSHSTVSRALANSPLINAMTKAKIQQIASESGYQVNQVARNLKTRSTKTIGLVIPEVSNPYYPKLIQFIADEVRASGFNLQLHLSGIHQEYEASCIASLYEHRVDGILLVTAENGLVAKEQVKSLSNSQTPVVLMGWIEEAEHFDIVTGNDAHGGSLLASHLLSLGHRQIAIIGKPPHRGIFDRIHGFQSTLKSVGISIQHNLTIPNSLAEEDQEIASTVQFLINLPHPPTAIFAYQDSIAASVCKHLRNNNVSIPDQMTIVGFDDIELATYLEPQLTTVGGHIQPLAIDFVHLLVEKIQAKSNDTPTQTRVITPNLIIRGSCAAPRTSQLSLAR